MLTQSGSGSERWGLNGSTNAEALGRKTAEGLTLMIDSIASELPVRNGTKDEQQGGKPYRFVPKDWRNPLLFISGE